MRQTLSIGVILQLSNFYEALNHRRPNFEPAKQYIKQQFRAKEILVLQFVCKTARYFCLNSGENI